MANIRDVAKAAGVSTATVSNVVNRSKYVSAELEERVKHACSELGYCPERTETDDRREPVIGVVISKMDLTYFPNVIRGLENSGSGRRCRILFQDSNYDIEREKASVEYLLSTGADGIILNSVTSLSDEPYLRHLNELHSGHKTVPVVSLERDLTWYGLDSVCVDNIGGAVMAVRHLLDQGCRNIIHVTGPADFQVAEDRIEGFRRAMKEKDCEDSIIRGDFSSGGGYQSVRKLLNSGRNFDALFCANDSMAVGAIKALREFGIHCPSDIRVIGFDNSYIASLIRPSLSTVHVPAEGMGEIAMRMLLERIRMEKAQPARLTELPIRLVPRRSSDPSRSDVWELDLP